MRTLELSKEYNIAAKDIFDRLDDLSVSGMHMTKSSMPLMGSRLNLEFLTPHEKGPHTRYRWTGRVMGLPLDFTVLVTKWVRNEEKIWETTGNPKLIIYSWIRMHLKVYRGHHGCTAYLSIAYKKPKGWLNKLLCFLFGDLYARWCLKQMLEDAGKNVEHPVAAAQAPGR